MLSAVLPEGSKRRQVVKRLLVEPVLPDHISSNYIRVSDSDLESMKRSLKENFFSHEPNGYLNTDAGQRDLMDHVIHRLESDRRQSIPWLDNVRPLDGARVLEIGCGTGTSTVALAEQGARVTAIDIDEKALVDAGKRAEIYGVDADFHVMNATQVAEAFSDVRFDFIIFWAALEHMTVEERLAAIRETWNMLPDGAFWCVTEAPNRLWFYDSHTSQLPFYNWLPDDMAIKYSSFSPRQKIGEEFNRVNGAESEIVKLQRLGRGVSFHEFQLTIGPVERLDVVSSLAQFHRSRLVPYLRWRSSAEHKYESFMRNLCPEIHPGFFHENLDLIIRKS